MKKIALVALLSVSLHSRGGEDFEYTSVMACGPEELEFFTRLDKLDEHKYYYFHFEDQPHKKDTRFVIWNDGKQYPSFRKIKLEHIFVQNGGVNYASFKHAPEEAVYNLIHERKDGVYNKIMRIDKASQTYITRASLTATDGSKKMYKPSYGICWPIKLTL